MKALLLFAVFVSTSVLADYSTIGQIKNSLPAYDRAPLIVDDSNVRDLSFNDIHKTSCENHANAFGATITPGFNAYVAPDECQVEELWKHPNQNNLIEIRGTYPVYYPDWNDVDYKDHEVWVDTSCSIFDDNIEMRYGTINFGPGTYPSGICENACNYELSVDLPPYSIALKDDLMAAGCTLPATIHPDVTVFLPSEVSTCTNPPFQSHVVVTYNPTGDLCLPNATPNSLGKIPSLDGDDFFTPDTLDNGNYHDDINPIIYTPVTTNNTTNYIYNDNSETITNNTTTVNVNTTNNTYHVISGSVTSSAGTPGGGGTGGGGDNPSPDPAPFDDSNIIAGLDSVNQSIQDLNADINTIFDSSGLPPNSSSDDAYTDKLDGFYTGLLNSPIVASLSAMPDLINLSQPACPVIAIDLMTTLGTVVSTSIHCDIFDDNKDMLSLSMLVVWSMVAFRIVMSS